MALELAEGRLLASGVLSEVRRPSVSATTSVRLSVLPL